MTDFTGLKVYGAIEHARLRLYVLGSKSVTSLENFINGYMTVGGWGYIHPELMYNVDDANLNLFKFWLQRLPLNPNAIGPSFSAFLLEKWSGNEENAFDDFFVLLDEFKNAKQDMKDSTINQWNNPIQGKLPHKINAVLDCIRLRPEPFLTSKSISALGNFIKGYTYVSYGGFYDASLIYNRGDIDINAFIFSLLGPGNIVLSPAPPFTDFLLESTSYDEEAAFEKFFLLLDEFRLLNKHSTDEGNVDYWWH